jgi:hypothetical protein
MDNPLYVKNEKSSQNSILFKNYFSDSFEDENDETEKENNIRTEDTRTLRENSKNEYNPSNNSIILNFNQDKILFNNLQYDSIFIRDIDPFKERNIQNNENTNFNGNILDELKKEENKENNKRNDYNNENILHDEYSTIKSKKDKRSSIKFDEEQRNNNKISSKSRKSKKNNKKNKGNDTTRELLKNKFLKFIKKYSSNSKNYSLSDDVEIEKSFYNFYDENFGKNGIDFDTNICTYEKNDGSKYNVTVNDLFDDRNEFDEFKNSIYIEDVGSNTEFTEKASKRNTSFQYNSSFVYDHDSLGSDYEDTMNYLCYNISTCIDEEYDMNEKEKNKMVNENILSGVFDDEEKEDNENKDIVKLVESKPLVTTNKGNISENSKLKENLKTFMESEAFKKVINNPETFILFLKSILIGYIDPKKIDSAKDKLFNMISNEEIEQIKKFVTDYVDIVEESEDKIKDMKEKSIMIEIEKGNATPCTDIIEQSPGFIARFNDIMIEKFTNINNAIINFTTALCPQIIKNGLNNIIKSLPFLVSFASLIPMNYVTSLLTSFPAGQTILKVVNDVITKSSFLTSSHLVLPQIAIIIGCLYKNFTRNSEDTSRGVNDDNSSIFMTKFMGLFEIFSKNLRNEGGLNNMEKDPSVITSKVVNAIFKTMMESKDLPPMFSNDKINSIIANLTDSLPNSENKLKACFTVFNDVMNKDNVASKELFDELINLLDREKLNNEDINKILTVIIKGCQNLPVMSAQVQDSTSKNNTIEVTSSNTDVHNGNISTMDLDKSYSVIIFSQVLDELKKSKGETDINRENKTELILNREVLSKYPEGEKIIHEYKKNIDSINQDRKIKMKGANEKRYYSLVGKNTRNDYEGDPHAEFTIRKNNTRGNVAEFSIKRGKSQYGTEQIIPKYYTSSISTPTSPIYSQRKYRTYDERQLNHSFSDNDINMPSDRLFSMEKDNGFLNLEMKNEWIDDEEDKYEKKSDFILESKGLNIGDSLIHDELFVGYSKDENNEAKIESSTKIINDYDNSKESMTRHEYSINSDDTYDRLFLSSNLNTSDDSINKDKGSIDTSKKGKKTKDQSFKQKVMRHFSREASKKIEKSQKYIEWENLPLEIVFNIFKNFSIKELAQLREVSRYFNYTLTNPVFYMNINLTNESDTADNEMLIYQWKLSNGYLLSLNLSQCNLINENVFKEAIDFKIQDRKINNKSYNERENLCFNNTKSKFEEEESLVQNLRYLDLSYCSSIYSSETICNFFKGISIQPDGTIIKKYGCINLEELNLSDLYQILDDNLLISIANSCPKLKKLYVSKGYDITNYGVKMILKKCTHLEYLKLVNCPKINHEALDTRYIEEMSIMSDNISHDLNLRYLNVSYCRIMEDNFVKKVADNCPFLEELHISGCQNISDEGMKYLVSGRAWKDQRIKVLDISGCYCIGDNGIKTITPSVIEKLDISDCSFITDFGLKFIYDGMPLLKEIGYENCSGTSSNGREKLLSKYTILTRIE